MTTETTLSQRSITALNDILHKHRKEMADDLEKLAGRVATGSGGSHGYGVRNTGMDPKAQRAEVDALIKSLRKAGNSLTAYEKYMLQAAQRHRKALTEQLDSLEEERKKREDNSDAIDENTGAQEDNTRKVRDAADSTKKFVKGLAEGTLYLKGLKEAVNEFQTSYKLGFKWDPITDAINGALMGMDPKAMMEFQAQYRRSSGAMASGIDGFNKLVAENQFEMSKYTGTMQSAAQAMGSLYELSHNMGLRLGDVAGSASDLFSEFKKMQAVTSITVEQFVEMNQRMLSNSDIQEKLLRLNQQQRSQYIQGLNQQQLSLQMMGLQKEVAEQLITASEAMSGKKGIDRLQDRYKTQIMLQSALGYDAQTASRIAILKNKPNKSADESEQLNRYMIQIAKDSAEKKTQGSLYGGVTRQGEFLIDALAEHLGQSDFITAGRQGALQLSGKTDPNGLIAHQVDLEKRNTDYLQKIAHHTTVMSDVLGGWAPSAAAALAGAVVATLLSKTKIIDSIIGRFMGAGGGPPVPPGGGPGPGGGRWGWARSALGRAGTGAAIGVAGNAVAGYALNPDNFADENKHSAQVAQTALAWGSTAAGIGMLAGPMGAAAAGAAAAIVGAGVEMYKYSKDYVTQMKTSIALGGKLLNGEQQKLLAEKQAKEQQIKAYEQQHKALIEQNQLTDEQLATMIKMRVELGGIDRALGVADLKQQAMGAGVANQFISKMLKGGASFSDTGDISDRSNQLQSMIQMAGVQGNVKDQLISNIKTAALNGGLSSDSWGGISQLEKGIRSGEDFDIPPEWKKYVDQGFATTAHVLQDNISSKMGSIADTDGGRAALSDTVSARQDAQVKVSKLEEELAALKSNPMAYGPNGGSSGLVNAKQRELEQAQATLNAQKAAADALTKAATGEAPLMMTLSPESLKQYDDMFGAHIRKITKQSSQVAKPQGMMR